jgi:N-acyl-D-aspartate/D-glutamate deacylase
VNRIIKEWENCHLTKVFEFEVIDRRTGGEDWMTFDISIKDGCFVSQHESLNSEQAASKFIASVQTVIDPDFSLDENLQAHYDDCQQAVIDSEFYILHSEED